jgi:hypothetical protein
MVTIADTRDIMSDWERIDYTAVADVNYAAIDYSMYIGMITYDAEDFCDNVYGGFLDECDDYIEDADLDFEEDFMTGDLVVAYMYQEDYDVATTAAFGGCIEETGQCWGYVFEYCTGIYV